MNRRNWIVVTLGLFAAMLFGAAQSQAATRAELKERFKARYPELRAAKEAGKIGETYKGFVEVVDSAPSDKATNKLIEEENNDRKELYQLLAADEKTTPEQVGEVNGERYFKTAAPGTYLKGRDGKWRRK